MQTSLLFVDLKSQGLLTDIGKIAIKMPKGQGELSADVFGEFADIIDSLMLNVTPEEMKESLEQTEWIRMEGGDDSGYVPLLDLTQDHSKVITMARRLFDEAIPEAAGPSELMKADIIPEPPVVDVVMQDKISDAPADMKNDVPADKISDAPAVTKNDAPADKINDALVDRQDRSELKLLLQSGGNQAGKDSAESEKLLKNPVYTDFTKSQWVVEESNPKPAVEQKISGTELDTPKTEHKLVVPKPAEISSDPSKTVTSDRQVASLNSRSAEEPKSETDGTRKASAPLPPMDPLKAKAPVDMDMGRQTASEQDGETDLPMKHGAKKQSGVETPFREFKHDLVEKSADRSGESNDPQNKTGMDSRAALQASIAKAKSTGTEKMDGVSGGKGLPSPTQDMQTNFIRQIVQRMSMQTNGTQSTMTIKLKPEFLGQVQMQITTDNQQVVVRMATESMVVKDMVEQGMQYLKTELQQHGLEIDKFDVFVANDNDENNKQGQDWAGFRQALKRRQSEGSRHEQGKNKKGETPLSTENEKRKAIKGAGEIDYFA